MTKMTSKVALSLAIASLRDSFNVETEFTANDVIEKLETMLASLEKKNTGEKPMTENQKQNETYKDDILMFLADGKHVTATEILNGVESFKNTTISNQRVSAILRLLRLANKIDREVVKGKTYFFVK